MACKKRQQIVGWDRPADEVALHIGAAFRADALHLLEGKQLIRAERGLITVRDRKGLEELAGDAYGVPEAEYRRVILGQ